MAVSTLKGKCKYSYRPVSSATTVLSNMHLVSANVSLTALLFTIRHADTHTHKHIYSSRL